MASVAVVVAAATDEATTPIPIIRRRKSIEIPSTLVLHAKHPHTYSSSSSSSSSSFSTNTNTNKNTNTSSLSSSSSSSYELVSLKPASYTSLRDILPSTAIQSPKLPSLAANSGYEISIRNRLVKQAAWAYLRPMSTSPGAGGSTVFHRLWNRLSDAVMGFVTHICNCFLLLSTQNETTTSSLL